MKHSLYIIVLSFFLSGCGASQSAVSDNSQSSVPEEDIVRIANDDIEYEIIIIEPGFNSWLISMARPEGYYSQSYMESRNQIYVQAWNSRVLQVNRFDPNLYGMQIDYNPNIDYGYEVNYKLYNYFIYFQLTYNQKLSTFIPRI
ncbi:DUF6146 family protein [Psychroserpens algicola]|uniref:DUF6146 family protein n=1 Tax=Psychroserpens algicola TaxID=1719034 RepID=A0ABT0H8J1_9FLAO|nr:DUF6146 family protein [Psychroserpens algicola]MCK8480673.1 DUF6146 family protein [Psychroserpens algicola]